MIDLSLYLVLDPVLCADRGMVQTALEAAQGGVTVVQLRAPQWKKRDIYQCALELKTALRPFNIPLIINDHVDVALAMDADGVHIGQKDLPATLVRQMIGHDKILGLSASRIEHAIEADPTIVDYLGIGPIFDTSTKPDADLAMGIEGFEKIAASTPLPNVAIGSVKRQHIESLISAGADGIAVVSAICGQPSPKQSARTLRQTWDRFSEATDR